MADFEDLKSMAVEYYDDLGKRDSLRDPIIDASKQLACANNNWSAGDLHPETDSMLTASLHIATQMKEIADTRSRLYDPRIELVHVLSGPGTYYKPLADTQYEMNAYRWMDRDRIRAGIAVVREVVQSRIRAVVAGANLEDIAEVDGVEGPVLFYDGQPHENAAFRKAIQRGKGYAGRLPRSNYLVTDVLQDDGRPKDVNTSDQARNLIAHLEEEDGLLSGVKNVAVVSHIAHMMRAPFYYKKEYDDYKARGGEKNIRFWLYGLAERRGKQIPDRPNAATEQNEKYPDAVPQHIAGQLMRLPEYLTKGYMAAEPCNIENVSIPAQAQA